MDNQSNYNNGNNGELGIYTWRYYPLRDSVYVNREEAPYADQGIGAYQKTDQPTYGAYYGSRYKNRGNGAECPM